MSAILFSMAILSEKTWDRHSNPWSGWTRALTMPVLGVALYLRNPWILAAVVIWAIINPILFPSPKRIDNWMSKGVLGEREYYKDKKYFKKDLPTLLNLFNIPIFVAFFWFGWNQQLIATILSGLLVMVIKFWFIDRMVGVYEMWTNR